MTNLAIAANELRKSYGDKVVLDGIDLAVPEGTIFSLLGEHGPHGGPAPATSWATSSASRRFCACFVAVLGARGQAARGSSSKDRRRFTWSAGFE